MKKILFVGFQFILLCNAFGHGDLPERIAALTEEISKDPTNPDLYFKRGQLYQQHEEPNKALADYLKAEDFGFREKILFFRQAEIYLEMKFFNSGLICTEKYLLEDANDIKIHKLRGELFIELEDYNNAISAFKFVIDQTKDLPVSQTGLNPENYLQLSESYLKKDSLLVDSALIVTEDGLSVLGDKVFFLQLKKLDYLKLQGDEEKIICQFDYFIDSSKRKEKWYFRKAIYLFDKKKYPEALESLKGASSSYQNLPPRIQNTKSAILIKNGIDTLKNRIKFYDNLPETKTH